jgi:outer membrane lipopolysaccharide assembly protein LptE/RlpB
MINKNRNIILLLGFLLLSGCGFKVLNKTELRSFQIKEIVTKGDSKINFLIKNNLMNNFSRSKANESVLLNISSTKNKEIKEKNIKNQITKYKISLITDVKIDLIGAKVNKKFKIYSDGSFDIASSHATTINNQNNLEKILAKKTSEKIINELIALINDL